MALLLAVQRYFRPPLALFGLSWCLVCPPPFFFFPQRKALVVLFQHWFSVAAEETSEASRLAVCLREVKKSTPSLLAFLVNMADDNGNTVLHYSVSHCNYGIVSLLLDTGETRTPEQSACTR